jgi:hypothetical protein
LAAQAQIGCHGASASETVIGCESERDRENVIVGASANDGGDGGYCSVLEMWLSGELLSPEHLSANEHADDILVVYVEQQQ